MTTTDSNGIMFLQTSDIISPFQTLMNSLQSATSTAVAKATRGPLYAANTTARNALLTKYGSSASNPLWVNTAGVLEVHNGTSWTTYIPAGGAARADTPLGHVTRSAAQSIPNGTWTPIDVWAAEPVGRKGGMNLVANALVVPTAGIYEVSGRAVYPAVSGGVYRAIAVRVGGVEVPGTLNIESPRPGVVVQAATPRALVSLSAGASVTLYLLQDSGTSLNVTETSLTVTWVRS